MRLWWLQKRAPRAGESRVREKYQNFRQLLTLNNECLEVMADLQEDLQYVPPLRDIVQHRIDTILDKAGGIVSALEGLTGRRFPALTAALAEQSQEVGRYIAARQELAAPRVAVSLSEVSAEHAPEAGGKAAMLAEVKNRLGLPVPDGFVLTTEAYRQFCGSTMWTHIRDSLHAIDLDDADALAAAARYLAGSVVAHPVPRAVEVAITERAALLDPNSAGLAVRSSAVGEAGERMKRSYAGQFLTLLNVPPAEALDAYKQVVAARFSEQAIFYRLSTGVAEVETPMAVLFLPVLRAKASGVMYTRDPSDPKSKVLWITAARGLGLEIASGRTAADLFVVSRNDPHETLDRNIVEKGDQLVAQAGGGLAREAIAREEARAASIEQDDIRVLAQWGVRIEKHFGTPQDIEWVLDEGGKLWILQSRPLALVEAVRAKKSRVVREPVLTGGRTIYPGRVSGPAHLAEDANGVRTAPVGAILFVRRPSPEMVEFFPRIGGFVAERGNVAGHVAALLREFKVPSVFLMPGAFGSVKVGDEVSLDAVQTRVFPGSLWPRRVTHQHLAERFRQQNDDPISQRLLTLNLIDTSGVNFRPSGCRSTHDVIRYCHEKAVAAMFEVNDIELAGGTGSARTLRSKIPVQFEVLDLGGGLDGNAPPGPFLEASHIASRPFQSFWQGVSNPAVAWTREMPTSLSDLVSVMAGSIMPQSSAMRGLGEKSYVLVADEYMNLNSRLAYHFTLVDACLSESPSKNYVAFRFAGGGATWKRRNLRACFVEACLKHHGFIADRRGDLVNAWFKKGTPGETGEKLRILGLLMACTCQLDMYMASAEVMQWYVQQFLAGNYAFRSESPHSGETTTIE